VCGFGTDSDGEHFPVTGDDLPDVAKPITKDGQSVVLDHDVSALADVLGANDTCPVDDK
jgi:hypothetical protein